MTRYACHPSMLPVIEGALAAHGYAPAPAHRNLASRTYTAVMQRAATTISLWESERNEQAGISIDGENPAVIDLLHTLPVHLWPAPNQVPSPEV